MRKKKCKRRRGKQKKKKFQRESGREREGLERGDSGREGGGVEGRLKGRERERDGGDGLGERDWGEEGGMGWHLILTSQC